MLRTVSLTTCSPGGDDDFDDFQAAPPSAGLTSPVAATSPVAQQKPVSPPLVPQQPAAPAQQSANLFSMLGNTTAPATTMSATRPPSYGQSMGAMMTPTMAPNASSMFASQPVLTPSGRPGASAAATTTTPAAKPAGSGNFDDLFTMALGSSSASVKPQGGAPAPAKSIKDLEKEKAQAGIWGGQQTRPPMGAGFGSFGGATASSAAAPPSSSGNGIDDLLF